MNGAAVGLAAFIEEHNQEKTTIKAVDFTSESTASCTSKEIPKRKSPYHYCPF
ncbi:hypothetical protein [Paenisporosarcina sp. OV554]|uniref:hypothetical protein n=1 Tax=Paenisporosarcina sp. OV554 TaxID=2135694 RepID=UPI001304F7C9|nr:hypothetical protein [Paenisporosarcina sp. OV554]